MAGGHRLGGAAVRVARKSRNQDSGILRDELHGYRQLQE